MKYKYSLRWRETREWEVLYADTRDKAMEHISAAFEGNYSEAIDYELPIRVCEHNLNADDCNICNP